ncbi:RNA 2',3'-cyclic phosphodiesterase [Peribacillus kribbensis]|uniref:RNA 2',3'-cyclic phosphodiesterase n=1 Tax=Peribacillus kribbensis TaxID=356658 RepID=UPI00068697CE|nr:RNA 2',3'-cyclic phosphodiesterase [Peribacillus kribbensis]
MDMHSNHFFAIKFPTQINSKIDEKAMELKKEHSFNKWLHPDDYHITLAFLGKIEENKLSRALESIKHICSEQTPFGIELSGIGTFGRESSPRILWAGVVLEPELAALQAKIYKACSGAGFELDKKPFKPHITIARKFIGTEFNKSSLGSFHSHFEADGVVLYKTNMGQSPSYETVEEFPFGS